MPPKLKNKKDGYTNLSIQNSRYDRIRRKWDTLHDPKEMTFTQWATLMMEYALAREQFINERFPHIKFIGQAENQIILDDTNRHQLVRVTREDDGLVCSVEDNKQEYILYASMTLLFTP